MILAYAGELGARAFTAWSMNAPFNNSVVYNIIDKVISEIAFYAMVRPLAARLPGSNMSRAQMSWLIAGVASRIIGIFAAFRLAAYAGLAVSLPSAIAMTFAGMAGFAVLFFKC